MVRIKVPGLRLRSRARQVSQQNVCGQVNRDSNVWFSSDNGFLSPPSLDSSRWVAARDTNSARWNTPGSVPLELQMLLVL
jgi:hypothetical protein